MEEEFQEYSEKAEDDHYNVYTLIDFQKKYSEFQSKVEKSVSIYTEFWIEIGNITPRIKKIQKIGEKISKIDNSLNRIYSQLIELNNHHIKLFIIYGKYLDMVVNDEFESQKILDRYY